MNREEAQTVRGLTCELVSATRYYDRVTASHIAMARAGQYITQGEIDKALGARRTLQAARAALKSYLDRATD